MSNLPPPPPPSQLPGNAPSSPQKNGRQPRKSPFSAKRNNTDPTAAKSGKQQLPKWAVWLIAAGALALVFGPRFIPTKNSEKLTYTEFLSQVRLGKVDNDTTSNDDSNNNQSHYSGIIYIDIDTFPAQGHGGVFSSTRPPAIAPATTPATAPATTAATSTTTNYSYHIFGS